MPVQDENFLENTAIAMLSADWLPSHGSPVFIAGTNNLIFHKLPKCMSLSGGLTSHTHATGSWPVGAPTAAAGDPAKPSGWGVGGGRVWTRGSKSDMRESPCLPEWGESHEQTWA